MKIILFLILCLFYVVPAHAVRIEDIANIEGVRSNTLIGTGLVVGLKGTGDGGKLAGKNLKTMFNRLGQKDVMLGDLNTKNVAVVIVTAQLTPFAVDGSKISVNVSSPGSASSVQGGRLLATPLKGLDGRVYAIAQGSVLIGQGEHLTVGTIPDGATVEDNIHTDFIQNGKLRISLRKSNFTTAKQVQDIVNQDFGVKLAKALNAGSIEIVIPHEYLNDHVSFAHRILQLPVILPDHEATVVINERTGTIIIDENVWISPVAINQVGLSVTIPVDNTIQQLNNSAQPAKNNNIYPLMARQGTKLKDIVDALNAMKVPNKDLIAILQSLKEAGALHAKLIIM